MIRKKAQAPERLALSLKILAYGRQAHEPAETESWQVSNLSCEISSICDHHARLRLFVVDIDLYTDIEVRQIIRPLPGKTLRCFQAIDGMYPVIMLRNGSRLVGLQVADEVPDEGRIRDQFDLFDTLENLIFAKIVLPRSGGLSYR